MRPRTESIFFIAILCAAGIPAACDGSSSTSEVPGRETGGEQEPKLPACTPGEKFTQGWVHSDFNTRLAFVYLRMPDSGRNGLEVALLPDTQIECIGGVLDKDLIKVNHVGDARGQGVEESLHDRPVAVGGDTYLQDRYYTGMLREEAEEQAAEAARIAAQDTEIRRLLGALPARQP